MRAFVFLKFPEIPLLASFPSDDYVVIGTELTERSLHTADKNVRPFFLYAVTFVVTRAAQHGGLCIDCIVPHPEGRSAPLYNRSMVYARDP